MPDQLTTFAALPAAGPCAAFPLSDEARAVLQANDTVLTLLDRLKQGEHWQDALRLVAYSLPKPAAVAWAQQCAAALGEANGATQQAALAATGTWLKARDDDAARRACFSTAEAAGFDSAAGCVALAAFWSSGSMAPADAPAIPPAAHLCHHAAACAAMLAGLAQPALSASYYRQFVELGQAIADGKQPF